MRLWRSILLRSTLTFAVSACFAGTGPVVTGVSNGGGGATTGSAPVLSFFSQPSSANVGQALPTVQVIASDSLGATDTTFTGSVSVALASNSSSGSLSGTLTRRAARGVASFNDLRIDRAGTYTLRASTANAAPVVSAAFTITTATGP